MKKYHKTTEIEVQNTLGTAVLELPQDALSSVPVKIKNLTVAVLERDEAIQDLGLVCIGPTVVLKPHGLNFDPLKRAILTICPSEKELAVLRENRGRSTMMVLYKGRDEKGVEKDWSVFFEAALPEEPEKFIGLSLELRHFCQYQWAVNPLYSGDPLQALTEYWQTLVHPPVLLTRAVLIGGFLTALGVSAAAGAAVATVQAPLGGVALGAVALKLVEAGTDVLKEAAGTGSRKRKAREEREDREEGGGIELQPLTAAPPGPA